MFHQDQHHIEKHDILALTLTAGERHCDVEFRAGFNSK